MSGRQAPYNSLSDAGFKTGGVEKGSIGAGMQSRADTTGGGKGVISDLQSSGAKGDGFSGDMSRGDMDSAGFGSGGVSKDSLGSHTMSATDKSGSGQDLKSTLQSHGAKK